MVRGVPGAPREILPKGGAMFLHYPKLARGGHNNGPAPGAPGGGGRPESFAGGDHGGCLLAT